MDSSAYSRKFPYLYRGVVESNIDPENMGRCRVRVPFIHGELNYPVDALPWARPIVLSPVRSKRGSVNIPDVGDIVWVFFEGAVRDFPVYIGGTYAKGEIIADPDIVDFYIEEDNKISYNRKSKEYEICVGDSKIRVTPEGVHILRDNEIEVNSAGVHIVGDTDIKGDLNVLGDINLSGNFSVSGNTSINGNLGVSGIIRTSNVVLTEFDMEGWE